MADTLPALPLETAVGKRRYARRQPLRIPASLLLGGSYLLLVDDIARSVYATETPLGILSMIA